VGEKARVIGEGETKKKRDWRGRSALWKGQGVSFDDTWCIGFVLYLAFEKEKGTREKLCVLVGGNGFVWGGDSQGHCDLFWLERIIFIE